MSNAFPESKAKSYLRIEHYADIMNRSRELNRNLVYFGLPSAELLDVMTWNEQLDHVFAVERDTRIVQLMLRNIIRAGLRKKTTLIEMDLLECTKILALEEDSLSQSKLRQQEQMMFATMRGKFFDVVNLDMYGRFLYKNSEKTNTNSEIIKNIFKHQSRGGESFTLLLTYNLRDTGAEEYDRFNSAFLDELSGAHKVEAGELKKYYLSDKIEGHPMSVRRLRLALPMHIMDLGRNSFEIASLRSWSYGTSSQLYHTRLNLRPRKNVGSLGVAWPPLDEIRRILSSEVVRLSENTEGTIISSQLDAPTITL